MNSLETPRIASVLADLHHCASHDWRVFLRAFPSVIGGALRGRDAMESAKPHLKDAFIPISPAQGLALYQFARARRAQHIVEFGASFGISTIYLAAAVRDNGGGRVITTEIERARSAAPANTGGAPASIRKSSCSRATPCKPSA